MADKKNMIIQPEDENGAVVADLKQIIDNGRYLAYSSVATTAVLTYWNVGKRIVQEEQGGQKRAEYGRRLLGKIAIELTKEYGENYSERNLRSYRQFYLQFTDFEIWYACVPNLTWTHYRSLIRVENPDARYWYVKEASVENWASRTLDRNIGSQYYFRLLQSPKKENVIAEMQALTTDYQKDKNQYIKSPVVAEFLGLENNTDYTETALEKAIINHLQKFIMELGKGYAFVARQKHIATDAGDYFIDLVFYNFDLGCFVIFDLKTTQITHQDVGQMDMYVRMFDEKYLKQGHNPTLGVLLCAETSQDIAKYSILNDSEQIFAAKYLTYMPSQEELRREILRQKAEFELQQKSHSQQDNDEEI